MNNAVYFISALYHPPNPEYQQQELLDYLSGRCKEILITNSSARMIIAADINQRLIKDFCLQNNLLHLVTKPTRGTKTLDVLIFKGLVRSDHIAIVVNSQYLAKPERKYVCFRDVRDRKIKMEKKLAEYDWSTIASVQDMDIAAYKLSDSILSLVNECFPQIKVRISSRHPPFMPPLVKHLCNLRSKRIKMGINPDLYRIKLIN